jgi:hypothetical protein
MYVDMYAEARAECLPTAYQTVSYSFTGRSRQCQRRSHAGLTAHRWPNV